MIYIFTRFLYSYFLKLVFYIKTYISHQKNVYHVFLEKYITYQKNVYYVSKKCSHL
nr:MAG TPA: hypothetical protein [Caudoviricetes sp.]